MRELERRTGISQAYISQIENGKRSTPNPDIIKKLAKGLNEDPNYLMTLAGYLTPIDEVDIFNQDSPFVFKKTDKNGVTGFKELSKYEIKKLTNLHDSLNMDIDIYYKNKLLTSEDKTKVLTMLQTILE